MASWYVDSTAAGAGTGADWANAFTTISAAFTAGAAGDTYYVAENHAQTQASALTITAKGTVASPDTVLCVDSAGSVPPVAADLRTTATISTTGANDLTSGAGYCYWHGVTFISGGSLRYSDGQHTLQNCGWRTTNGNMVVNGVPGHILNNHTFTFDAVGQRIYLYRNNFIVNGCTLAGSSPTTFLSELEAGVTATFNGCDLSAVGANTLFAAPTNTSVLYNLNNCKLGASTIGVPTAVSSAATLSNCSSTDTNYSSAKYTYQATQTVETVFVKSGGATDGTTPISWKIVSTANAEYPAQAYRSMPIWSEFIDTVGSPITATVDILRDSATNLTDAEIWIEVQYLGTSGFPLGAFVSDAKVLLATAADQAASSATWTTTDMSNPNEQKLEVTFTPQEKGIAVVTVCVGKASATVYVDPKVVLS